MYSTYSRLRLSTVLLLLLAGAEWPLSAFGQVPPTLFAPGQPLPPTYTAGTTQSRHPVPAMRLP